MRGKGTSEQVGYIVRKEERSANEKEKDKKRTRGSVVPRVRERKGAA